MHGIKGLAARIDRRLSDEAVHISDLKPPGMHDKCSPGGCGLQHFSLGKKSERGVGGSLKKEKYLLVFENKFHILIGKGHKVCADKGHDTVQDSRLHQIHVPNSPVQPYNRKKRTLFRQT